MAIPDKPLTKILVEVPPHADVSGISTRDGVVAEVFDSSGKLALRPCELAETAHPADIWFRLDLSGNRFMEGLREMGKLAHMGFSNFGMLLSGLKDSKDLHRVRLLAAECGFSFGLEIPFGVMIEYPGMALSYDAVSKAGASFVVMDIDALSKRIMFSEKADEAIAGPVLKIIEESVGHFKDRKIHVAVRGSMLEHTDVLKELAKQGIDSVVVHPDNAEKLKLKMLYAEKTQEIDFLKSKMRMGMKRNAE